MIDKTKHKFNVSIAEIKRDRDLHRIYCYWNSMCYTDKRHGTQPNPKLLILLEDNTMQWCKDIETDLY